MNIHELLQLTVKNNASDLHILVGIPPSLRIDGSLRYLSNYEPLTRETAESLIFELINPEQKELLLANKELDFSFGFTDGGTVEVGRFRINAYFQKGNLAAALRYLPPVIRTIEQLQLPKTVNDFAGLRQGFVLVTGPTGHGKSSTLAAMINQINQTKADHILTIEDPIEYVYPKGNCIISQRELGTDTHSWAMALRSALREDPDVVLVGEMRDPETMQAALTIAETGHLVFATLHTNSAAQSIDRIVDAFPDHQRAQIRIQLAATLKGIISQRLIPKITGGRVPAVEILLGTSAVASNIRDGKTHLIDSTIQTSKDVGMVTLEDSLGQLVKSGQVSLEVAKAFAVRPDDLMRMLG